MSFNTLCVIGLGYIGLPTATVFTLAGCHVIGVDIQPEIVARTNQGIAHFAEPALAQALKQALETGNFSAKCQPQPAEAFIIAVPTPLSADKQPDLSAVFAAADHLAPVLRNGNLIVLESTSPVGTTEQLAEHLHRLRPDLTELHVAYCPERVLPGNIMQEIYHNDRIIGGLTPKATEQAVQLYQRFTQGNCLPTSARTAELCKLAENSFRDVNIAFANELSMICDRLHINVWELISLTNRHPRVNILQPGCGVGGHCIAVDPWFMLATTPDEAQLIRTARMVNDHKPHWVIDKVKARVADCAVATDRKPSDITIACLGLTFKPDVGDLRESPALAITRQLADWHSGALWAVEPHIEHLPADLQKKVDFVPLDCALEQADILVLLVDHHAFKAVAPSTVQQKWRVDCRGVWE